MGISNYNSVGLSQRSPVGGFRHFSGLKLADSFSGDAHHANTRIFHVPVGNASAIFHGDILTLLGTGAGDRYEQQFTNGGPGLGNPAQSADVGLYAPGNTSAVFVGVVVGFELTLAAAKLSTHYLPAATEGWVRVCVDPDAIYYATAGGAALPSGGWPAAIGAGIDLAAADMAKQSTRFGISGRAIDPATVGVTATLPLRVLGAAGPISDDVTTAPSAASGQPVIAVSLNRARHFLGGGASFVA